MAKYRFVCAGSKAARKGGFGTVLDIPAHIGFAVSGARCAARPRAGDYPLRSRILRKRLNPNKLTME